MYRLEENVHLTTFKIAATYVGTVVGAGFASGQEVLQFFGQFRVDGLWGLLMATCLFGLYGWAVLDLGMKLGARSHVEVIQYVGGRWLGRVIDYIITFFLFGVFTAMAAGAGAIFAEQFQWPAFAGGGFMAVVTVFTVLLGLNGVITSISLVVPILLGSVTGIALWTILDTGFLRHPVFPPVPAAAPVPFWPLAAVVYVSYNLVMSVAILAPMGAKFRRSDVLGRGALLGGLGLGLGSVAIFLALAPYLPVAGRFQIPMIYVAGHLHPILRFLYSLVLLAEIYTTAVGCLYGFAARLTSPGELHSRLLIIGTGAAAFLASLIGFTTLVRTLYPLVGYAGFLLLLGLTYVYIFRKKGAAGEAG